MKVNILDAHDRFTYLQKDNHSDDIGKCCQSLIDQKPFGDYPFYIFAHKREIGMDERFNLFTSSINTWQRLEDVPTHRIIWQPRLTKPEAQTNSMLFKAYPNTDAIKIIWMIPERALWDQYKKGNLTENKLVVESIHAFETDRKRLEAKEDDDLSDETIDKIYEDISRSIRQQI